MSRTAATKNLNVVRGSTWEDYFDYKEDDKITPINLAGYSARMQVRTSAGEYGLTTASTLLMELTTANSLITIIIPPGGTIANRVFIKASPIAHAALNPTNLKKIKYAYSLELFIPAGVNPEYVLPLVKGTVNSAGEVTR